MTSQLFAELTSELNALNSPIFAAETHGSLCGLYCLQNQPDIELWYSLIIDENQQQQPEHLQSLIKLLGQLRNDTEQAFAASSGGVDLLLPDDNADLQTRLAALIQWCEGLLYGLGVAGLKDEQNLPEQAREFIQDVREISRLDPESADDEAENDFMELVEYLRVGVLVLREEMLPDAKINTVNPNQTEH